MKKLELWQSYTREEVHDIFSPDTSFTPQAGSWGMQGIIRLPGRPDSFVFFVTFGKVQGEHAFDESITTEGVLSWQSQPRQRLDSPVIKTLIEHDDQTESIYLFLRTRSGEPYVYMGTLGYLTHDREREQPIHFQWQLLNWPAPPGIVADMRLELVPPDMAGSAVAQPAPSGPSQLYELLEHPPPQGSTPGPSRSGKFKSVKMALHPDQDARNKELGRAGEELVLEAERRRLKEAGRGDLAAKVVHVAAIEGDGAGYDIKSFTTDGSVRHLEVKTTRNGASTGFFVSPNEIAFSEGHLTTYELVRVFYYDSNSKSGSCYRIPGSLSKSFNLVPSQFRASFAGSGI